MRKKYVDVHGIIQRNCMTCKDDHICYCFTEGKEGKHLCRECFDKIYKMRKNKNRGGLFKDD